MVNIIFRNFLCLFLNNSFVESVRKNKTDTCIFYQLIGKDRAVKPRLHSNPFGLIPIAILIIITHT